MSALRPGAAAAVAWQPSVARTDRTDLDRVLAIMNAYIVNREWSAARTKANEVAALAMQHAQGRELIAIGDCLERLQEYSAAGHCLAKAGRERCPSSLAEWDGGPLTGRTILIVQRLRHISAPLRSGRLILDVSARARKCIVLADARLVSLFRRSLVEADILQAGRDDDGASSAAQVIASYETLMEHLVMDEGILAKTFVPLIPDRAQVAELRRRYARSGRPVVGISWSSTNRRKELPALADWAASALSLDRCYVALQYGDVESDIEALRTMSGREIVLDRTVDPLRDLDGFASQVAAMDEVLTISNTTAHMAGALGVMTTVILDDKAHLTWPLWGNSTGFYPSVRLIRKDGRAWSEVLEQAAAPASLSLH